MSFNPFNEHPLKVSEHYYDWDKLCPKPYDKQSVDPHTRLNVILANGAEFSAITSDHQMHRTIADNDARRELAVLRKQEQQQQKRIAALKPINEGILEHTIGYEQLAVELTASFAKSESDKYVKQALDFALLEDFDHLYRYADLLEMDKGIEAEHIVGQLTEIMPARPTIAHHRHPHDDVKRFVNGKRANMLTNLHIAIITAAEQQTMNYYMNQAGFYPNKLGRQLITEIGMIEEQHVTMYGGLMDANLTWAERLLSQEYTECYLYYSLWQNEKDKYIKNIWEEHFNTELLHLHTAASMLERYENKVWQQVIPKGEFPELITFDNNIEYVRQVIKDTVNNTGKKEEYIDVSKLEHDYPFFEYQREINDNVRNVASHGVIAKYIADSGKDYRYETAIHPIEDLRDRRTDNTEVGR